ncbi:hypothetical protein EPJ70_01695 [Brachyspira aalborgi]|uniref:Uncharacterized protein n=1 Tax=Brachyspira aalborgi TaxID=29522 RepID=A0A5C8F828_9SPIR|nr:hypothetical protein EPJ70_01695 [Brachyspira aalborgi]
MEDNNNQIKKNNLNLNQKPNEKNASESKSEPLIEYENGWTVEDTMAMCPSLTREEAIIAHRMGW